MVVETIEPSAKIVAYHREREIRYINAHYTVVESGSQHFFTNAAKTVVSVQATPLVRVRVQWQRRSDTVDLC